MINMILLLVVFLLLVILEIYCVNYIIIGILIVGEVEIRCVLDNYVKKIMVYNRDCLFDVIISII